MGNLAGGRVRNPAARQAPRSGQSGRCLVLTAAKPGRAQDRQACRLLARGTWYRKASARPGGEFECGPIPLVMGWVLEQPGETCRVEDVDQAVADPDQALPLQVLEDLVQRGAADPQHGGQGPLWQFYAAVGRLVG